MILAIRCAQVGDNEGNDKHKSMHGMLQSEPRSKASSLAFYPASLLLASSICDETQFRIRRCQDLCNGRELDAFILMEASERTHS